MAAFAVFLAVVFTILSPFPGARAQDGIMSSGDLAVTGFSGTKDVNGQTFIDTDGASLKIFGMSGKGQPHAQVVDAPVKFQAFARDIGQVFGVTLDNAPNPNIYATPTSVHGLQVVVPDSDGFAVPERVNTGRPGATFMDGQFGTTLGGGPGTVWRIDGTTGEISRFADIAFEGVANSGPGLGNITFDPAHYQFYVSDMDTGVIHRLDLSGNDLGTFDHGVDGRTAAGLAAVAMNPANRMDIASPAFDTTNPATWGLASEQRRVWGLSYYKGRLYYGVAADAQVWSVGINTDGSFAADARVEVQSVPGGFPVADILFTPKGRMVVAQRGGILGAHDYSAYHQPKQNRVLRYRRDLAGNWIQEPDEYAIGFPVNHRNASGGVGLACDGTLWSTGDALRNDPALSAQLLPGGPLVVHGVQGNNISLIRPFNVPPWSSWFVDYQGQPASETDAGHVGDVEVYRKCSGGYTESYPGWYPIPEWYPPEGWIPPVWWPKTPDLEIEKFADKCVDDPAAPGSLLCSYTIVTTNFSGVDFVGQLHVTDNPPATAVFVPPAGGSIPWSCAQPGGAGTPIECESDNVETLHPGESETLDITIQVTPAATDKYITNCAILDADHHGFNEDCDETELPRPDLETRKHFWGCQPEGANQRCFFILEFENVGGVPYTGALHFVENVPAGTIFGAIHLSTTPGWGCVGGPPIECKLPDPPGITMNPGDVEQVLVSIIVPAGVHGDFENCVALGHPTHEDDPVAPGVNKACAPFTIAEPFEPKCPAGWQKVPLAGAPADWQVISLHGFAPDGTPWGIMCMRPKPEEELPLGNPNPQPEPKCGPGETKFVNQNQIPVGWQKRTVFAGNKIFYCAKPFVIVPMPKCKPHEKKFSKPQDVPNGWTKRKVSNGVFTIWCAIPPIVQPEPEPKCGPGETKFINQNQVPKGWKVRTVFAGNKIFYCAKPGVVVLMPKCKPHEKKFLKPQHVPNGWTKRKVTKGLFTIWCATPGLTHPLPTCGRGETKFSSAKQVPSGWTKRKVTSGKSTIWCAKPGLTYPLPSCGRGETKFSSAKKVPQGWTKRKVTSGKTTIWCAKPGLTYPTPTCGRGETKFSSAKKVPQGWTKRKVTLGKTTIWCAKPGVIIPPKPKCVGGKLVMLKSMPPKWRCICPRGWNNIRGTCKKPPISSTPTPEIKPCPRGWKRINGKCTPPVKPCNRGWKRINGKCTPPNIQSTPTVKPCKRGWSRVNGKCQPPRIRTTPKVKPKPRPRTQLVPSSRLKRAKRTNLR